MNSALSLGLGRAARANLKELATVFLVVFVVLLLLSLGSRFSAYLQDAMVGDISADALWLMLVLRIPEFVQIVSPFSLFLATLFLMGRLDSDSELPVLQSAGVGPWNLIKWLAWFFVPFTFGVGLLSLYVTPWSNAKFTDLLTSQELINEFDVLKAKTFRTYNDGQSVTYMHEVDRESGSVKGVFTNQLKSDQQASTIVAESGSYHKDPNTGDRYLELTAGRQHHVSDTGNIERIAFDTLTQRLDAFDVGEGANEVSSIATANLNASNPSERMEWHWRIGLPIMSLILVLCAIGMGRLKPRSGRYDRFLPGILYLAGYYGLTLLAVSQLSSSEDLSVIGLWPIHLFMGGVAVYFLRKNWNPA